MRWDTVKLKIGQHLVQRMREGDLWSAANFASLRSLLTHLTSKGMKLPPHLKGLSLRELVHTHYQELEDVVWDTVMNWDIRCAGQLRTLFPDQWPRELKTGPLHAFMEDTPASHWHLTTGGVETSS